MVHQGYVLVSESVTGDVDDCYAGLKLGEVVLGESLTIPRAVDVRHDSAPMLPGVVGRRDDERRLDVLDNDSAVWACPLLPCSIPSRVLDQSALSPNLYAAGVCSRKS